MYAGQIVERTAVSALFARPLHPYTRGLRLPAPPRGERQDPALKAIPGNVLTITGLVSACRFAPRCPIAIDRCRNEAPGSRFRLRSRRRPVLPAGRSMTDPASSRRGKPHEALPRGERMVGLSSPPCGPWTASRCIWTRARSSHRGRERLRKSTLGRGGLRLIEPTSGAIRLDGTDVLALSRQELRKVRRRMQIVFQDPMRPQSADAGGRDRGEPSADPQPRGRKRPRGRKSPSFEHRGLSGGRRVPLSARILGRPAATDRRRPASPSSRRFLSPTSRFPPSTPPCRPNILNFLQDLKEKYDTLLHLHLARSECRPILQRPDRHYVPGTVRRGGTNAQVFGLPHHPYTVALLSAVPSPIPPGSATGFFSPETLPNPAAPPPGCRFHTRCPLRMPLCEPAVPALTPREDGRLVACHLSGPARMGG